MYGISDLEDPVAYIQETLEEIDGLQISRDTIDRILTYYNDFKFNLLASGAPIREKNICDYYPTVRMVANNYQGTKQAVVKLNTKIDPELARAFASRVVNSAEVRDRVRPKEYGDLPEGAIDLLRKRYLD